MPARRELVPPTDDPPFGGALRRPPRGLARLTEPLRRGSQRRRTHAESLARELIGTLTLSIKGSRTIAVVSTKGGVGKTTTVANLGHTLATWRRDRVIAVDANPDAGSLAWRTGRQTTASIADLLRDQALGDVYTYRDIGRYTSKASSRLEILAAPDDAPHDPSAQLRGGHYDSVLELLRTHFPLILVDCATGILESITQHVVVGADQLAIVTEPSLDAARATSFLLAWLADHGHSQLAADAILVVNALHPDPGSVDLPAIEAHFAEQVAAIVRIPFDERLEAGAKTALEDLSPATRQAYVHLGAVITDACAGGGPQTPPPQPLRQPGFAASAGRGGPLKARR